MGSSPFCLLKKMIKSFHNLWQLFIVVDVIQYPLTIYTSSNNDDLGSRSLDTHTHRVNCLWKKKKN